jgi:hypothetical protein
MTTSDAPRRANRRRRYFLDDASQSSVLACVFALVAGTGAACAAAAAVLSSADLLGDRTLAEALPALLATLAGCTVLGALVAIPVVMRLTHRYVGPALVMRRALVGMRHGDYGCRLQLRRRDYLKSLAREIDAHRSTIARRDVAQARLLNGIRASLDAGDLQGARALVRVHGRRLGLEPVARTSAPEEEPVVV